MNIITRIKLVFIPKGYYCYSGHLGKGLCPFYSHIYDEGVKIPYCKYINQGDISNIGEFEFNKLIEKYKDDVLKKYPLDLLWDQCKECGVKC